MKLSVFLSASSVACALLLLSGCGDDSANTSTSGVDTTAPVNLEQAMDTVAEEESDVSVEEEEVSEPLPQVIEEGPLPKGELRTLEVAGMTRQYRLQVPEAVPEGGRPILLTVHGGGEFDGNFPFPQEALFYNRSEEEGFIVAHPLAKAVGDNEGAWQLNTTPNSIHDMEFMIAMLDDIEANFVVNPKRIYASGYSLGSMFNYEIACQLNNRFAAVASYAGTMPTAPTYCEMTHPIAVMHIHGVADPIIPYSDSWTWKAWDSVGEMMSIPDLVEYWKTKHNCQNTTETEGASSAHIVHSSCDGGARVEHHRLPSVGHEWPDNIEGVSTHQIIWEFVSEFSTP